MGQTHEAAQYARWKCFALQDFNGMHNWFLSMSPDDKCSFRVRLYANAGEVVSWIMWLISLKMYILAFNCIIKCAAHSSKPEVRRGRADGRFLCKAKKWLLYSWIGDKRPKWRLFYLGLCWSDFRSETRFGILTKIRIYNEVRYFLKIEIFSRHCDSLAKKGAFFCRFAP